MEAQTSSERRSDDLESRFGNRFVCEDVPDRLFPAAGMPAQDAMRMIGQELVLDGDPQRNLATFVTTWMEPEAQRVIAETLHVNFIDHAEYPRTAEIEQRCIRMLADLFNAPGETTGARTQGSSEAIMLGALALVKETLSHALARCLAEDIGEACATLAQKGGLHESERKRIRTGTGY